MNHGSKPLFRPKPGRNSGFGSKPGTFWVRPWVSTRPGSKPRYLGRNLWFRPRSRTVVKTKSGQQSPSDRHTSLTQSPASMCLRYIPPGHNVGPLVQPICPCGIYRLGIPQDLQSNRYALRYVIPQDLQSSQYA